MKTTRKLVDTICRLENQLKNITGELSEIDGELKSLIPLIADEEPLFDKPKSCPNIIPFPNIGIYKTENRNAASNRLAAKTSTSFDLTPFDARPGQTLPSCIFDYRPFLQRKGLLLLAWDKRDTEAGERLSAYWVTSTGMSRYYASKQYAPEDFCSAEPDHKSYAAEDGIDFFGQTAPDYIVHVAPELMMSNPCHAELRQAHIDKLKLLGSDTDFEYKYLLTKEKKQRHLHNIDS